MCLDDCDGGFSRRQGIAGAAALIAMKGATLAADASDATIPGKDVSFANGSTAVSGRLFRPESSKWRRFLSIH